LRTCISKIDANRAATAKLRSDPATGLGIKELAVSVDQSDKEAEALGLRSDSYDYAEVPLEIAVLIGSVALLTVRRSIIGLALFTMALALIFFVNGFTLTFHI
jgi:hypothetical protein